MRTPPIGSHKPPLVRGHEGQFPQGHSVDHWGGNPTCEGLELRLKHGTLQVMAVGIGPIEDHKVHAFLSTSFHHEHEGAHVGVKSGAHILNVKHHRVEPFELLGLRFTVFAMEGIHLQPRQGVHTIVDVRAVGCFSPKTVLRSKHVPDVDTKREQRVHEVRSVRKAAYHAGVVADDSDFFALQQGEVGLGSFIPQRHVRDPVGVPGLRLCTPGQCGEEGCSKEQTKSEVGHELGDAFGHCRFGFGARDVVDAAASFSGKHCVEPFQELRIVVEAVLQILRHSHAVFAMVGREVHVNPAAEFGLCGGDFLLGNGHKPPLVPGGEKPAMPGDRIVDGDDVPPHFVCAHGVRELVGYSDEVPCSLHVETLNLRRKTPSLVLWSHVSLSSFIKAAIRLATVPGDLALLICNR